jgi:hypothetical protein
VVIGPRPRAYAIVLGTFVLGGLCGAGVGYTLSQRSLSALLSEERSEARDLRRLEAFTRELHLSDECGQAMKREKDTMDAEIRALLTAEQQRSFEALRERRAKFFRGEK